MYEIVLTSGLVLAVLANIYQIKSLKLCFIFIFVLVIFPYLIPESITKTALWFPFAILSEIGFAGLILATRATPSIFIASVCGYNCIAHIAGWYAFVNDSPIYASYDFWLRTGELVQVSALIISSRIVTTAIIEQHLKCF